MGTRSMTLFGEWNGPYVPHYRHMDGYPTGLGLELIKCLKEKLGLEEIIEKCGLTPPNKDELLRKYPTVADPADAFLKVQGDLDYVYVVKDLQRPETTSLEILRTSNPYDWTGEDPHSFPSFVFPIWFSYVRYFPEDPTAVMKEIERNGLTTLRALAAYHKALNKASEQI